MSRFGEGINTKNITKTKIVATLGPASDSREVLEQLILAGVDVARLNFSHGTLEEKRNLFNLLRELSAQYDHQLSIMADIQGPKIRTGRMEAPFTVDVGDILRVTPDKIVGSKENGIQISYAEMLVDLVVGDDIFINDGIIKLTVFEKEERFLVCEVLSAGKISDKKGCNIPSGNLSVNIITPKDEEDLKLIAELKPDFLACSFVGTADDVMKIRAKLEEFGNTTTRIISKIERPNAVDNIDSIIDASDGIMVARGDLGVEIDTWLVPIVQKDLCRKCNIVGKPVIVATQMLESMTNTSRPTRAEASDVFNAVLDGTDAVMLSGETSVGVDPVHVVKIMDTIIKKAEEHLTVRRSDVITLSPEDITGRSILDMALSIHKMGKKGTILVYSSKSSKYSRMISKYRPPMDIVAFSHKGKTVQKLNLQWGVRTVYLEHTTLETQTIKEKSTYVAKEFQKMDMIDDQDYFIFASRTNEEVPTLALYSREKFLALLE